MSLTAKSPSSPEAPAESAEPPSASSARPEPRSSSATAPPLEQAESLVAECGGPDLCQRHPSTALHPRRRPHSRRSRRRSLRPPRLRRSQSRHLALHDAAHRHHDHQQWRSTLGTNLDSVFGVIRAAVAQMQSQPQSQPATGNTEATSSSSPPPPASAAKPSTPTTPPPKAPSSASPKASPPNSSLRASTQLRRPRLGRHRDVRRCPQRPRNVQKAAVPHPPRPPRTRRRDRRAHPLSLHPLRRLHLRRDLQRQRRRSPRQAERSRNEATRPRDRSDPHGLLTTATRHFTLRPATSPAQHPNSPAGETTDQRGRKLLDQMLEALGGDAWLHRRNVRELGHVARFFRGAPTGIVIDFTLDPPVRQRQTIPTPSASASSPTKA